MLVRLPIDKVAGASSAELNLQDGAGNPSNGNFGKTGDFPIPGKKQTGPPARIMPFPPKAKKKAAAQL